MQSAQLVHSQDRCLRFVFANGVHSFDLAGNATFGDIARALEDMASKRRGVPVGIDVTFAAAPASAATPSVASSLARRFN